MMSLYERTMSFILQYVEEHELREGDRLPAEPELATMAGVSMVTVRRALAELAAQAVVRREQGRGTFLARSRVSAETTTVGALRNGLSLDARSSLETRLRHLDRRPATDEEARRLEIADASAVWEISRLRLLDGRPMIHEVSIIPMILAPDLGAHVGANPNRSLYATLDQEYGLREVREEQTLVCRRAKPADTKLLELPRQDWVVEISGISYTTRNVPIDSFRMTFDAKGFAFRMETAPKSAMEAIELGK
jgi:DNA-binding GntR family transcriptional regulator